MATPATELQAAKAISPPSYGEVMDNGKNDHDQMTARQAKV